MRELYATVTKRVAALRATPGDSRGNAPFAGPHTRFNRPVVPERTLAQFSSAAG